MVKVRGATRRAQIAQTCWVSQFPGDRRKCLELLACWVCWKQEQEHEVHRTAIDRFKINRLVQARQNTERLVEPLNARMGDRHAAACAGRSQRLAFENF